LRLPYKPKESFSRLHRELGWGNKIQKMINSKLETLNSKQTQNTNVSSSKLFVLDFKFGVLSLLRI